MRQYLPPPPLPPITVVFAHGGYGVFEDLELQDGPCRIIATTMGCRVVSVDYRLAPEYLFNDALADVSTVVGLEQQHGQVIVWGDSAGAALAVSVPGCLEVTGTVLTSPNLDLSLTSFDLAAPQGPDLELSRYAFDAWQPPVLRLDQPVSVPPSTLVVVGKQDALLPEARAFARRAVDLGAEVELVELDGRGHGFLSEADVVQDLAARAAERFLPTR